jgi:hypothetical protein
MARRPISLRQASADSNRLILPTDAIHLATSAPPSTFMPHHSYFFLQPHLLAAARLFGLRGVNVIV